MDAQNSADALQMFAATLMERALESRAIAASATAELKPFESGRNMAYFEVVDILGRIADEFSLSRSDLGLPVDALTEIASSMADTTNENQ